MPNRSVPTVTAAPGFCQAPPTGRSALLGKVATFSRRIRAPAPPECYGKSGEPPLTPEQP
jgi:hypothetical protein